MKFNSGPSLLFGLDVISPGIVNVVLASTD
jgi:hypothetical protein